MLIGAKCICLTLFINKIKRQFIVLDNLNQEFMGNVLLSGIIAFIITFFVIPLVIKVAKLKKLYDVPDERKIHSTPVPSLGGIGIFVGFILSLLLFADGTVSFVALESYIAAFVVIFFVGVKDDIMNISAFKKLGGQVFVSLILIFKANLIIQNMHGFLGIYQIHESISYALTLFTIIVTMNAYNLIDGVDGLAGAISIITSATLGFFFLTNNDYLYSLMAFSYTGSLVAFLIFNFSHTNKIFMGDTGSMLSGTLNVILVIHFINTATNTSYIFPITSAPAVGFGILMLPLLDTLRVFGIRMIHGKSPFSPDRNHLHHILLDRGLSHMQITLTISVLAVLGIFISYFSQALGTTKLILLQISFFFIGVYVLSLTKKRTGREVLHIVDESGHELDGNENEHKVINASTFLGKINKKEVT